MGTISFHAIFGWGGGAKLLLNGNHHWNPKDEIVLLWPFSFFSAPKQPQKSPRSSLGVGFGQAAPCTSSWAPCASAAADAERGARGSPLALETVFWAG